MEGVDLGVQSDSISGVENKNGSPKLSMDGADLVFVDVPDQIIDGKSRTGVSRAQMGADQNLVSSLQGGFLQNVNWKREQESGVVSPNSKAGGGSKQWSEIVRPKEGYSRMKFEYHTPEVVDGKVVIKPPLHVDVQGRKAWENCLVGYFFENRVAFHVMHHIAKRKWSKRGLLEVIMNNEGFFFFKFETEKDLLEILEEGVCLIEGKPLILQRWYPQIELSKEVPRFIPLWVKIFNIPLQYWNKEGLSRIASPLPGQLFVLISYEDGRNPMEVSLKVEYPWRPSWCSKCLKFGHSALGCPVLTVAREMEQIKIREIGQALGDVKDQEEGFTVVQRKGKEGVVMFDSMANKANSGSGESNSFHYVNKGNIFEGLDFDSGDLVVETNNNKGYSDSGVVKNKADTRVIGKSGSPRGGGQVVSKGLLPTPVVGFKYGVSNDLGGATDYSGSKNHSMGELLNARVSEYICSGSSMSQMEKKELDRKIAKKEMKKLMASFKNL
ncbi:hypothetical protein AgCh_030893 [Apium graveolens]